MRLDKFLKVSRLIKRRSEAKKACLANCIKVNHQIAKAGDEIKIDDEIEINFTTKILQVKVLEVPLNNIQTKKDISVFRVIKEMEKEENIISD
jgi:ribosomal 50S subunit-recycling heat shock protein